LRSDLFPHELTDFACGAGVQPVAECDEGVALGLFYPDDKLAAFLLVFAACFVAAHDLTQ
jgi:hypothetical protein